MFVGVLLICEEICELRENLVPFLGDITIYQTISAVAGGKVKKKDNESGEWWIARMLQLRYLSHGEGGFSSKGLKWKLSNSDIEK